jgi:hypothetical protein
MREYPGVVHVYLQDGNDRLSFIPAHFPHQLDACNKITCTTGSQKQTIVLHEVPGHADSFCIRYSVIQKPILKRGPYARGLEQQHT